MTFSGPKGYKNQFNAEVSGIVGGGLSTVLGGAEYITAGTNTGKVLQNINPNRALNNAIEKATGMENNPNLDTRSSSEISVTNALGRHANAEKWAGAARKEGFTGYDKKEDTHVNAVNYTLALLQPSLDEFKSKHPKISQGDMKKVRAEAIDIIMSDRPYSDSGFTEGLKKLFRQSPTTGALENGKLSADAKEDIKDRLKNYYSDLREGAKN